MNAFLWIWGPKIHLYSNLRSEEATYPQGFDFRFWRAQDADWWENEPVKTGLDGLDVAGRGQE